MDGGSESIRNRGSPVRGWRVKVYRLDSEGKWVDEGTGNVQCKFLDRINGTALQVISDNESDPEGKVILESAVVNDDIYQVQNRMIITWTEPGSSQELALSFEDTRGCEDIWEQIGSIQGRVSGSYSASGGFGGHDGQGYNQDGNRRTEVEKYDLPYPSIENLEKIAQLLSQPLSPQARESYIVDLIHPVKSEDVEEDDGYDSENKKRKSKKQKRNDSSYTIREEAEDDGGSEQRGQQHQGSEQENQDPLVMQETVGLGNESNNNNSGHPTIAVRGQQSNNDELETNEILETPKHGGHEKNSESTNDENPRNTYIGKLLDLLGKLEAAKNDTGLHWLFSIIRSIMLLNDPLVTELLLTDDYFEDAVGALEYDPEVSPKQNHRDFLRSKVEHKMVVPIEDSAVLSKIHQSFRLRFFKDVLLPRALDENVLGMLTEMEKINGVQIATALHSDANYLPRIFSLIRSPETNRQKRSEAVACLQELCSLAKKMQVPSRNAFYRSLLKKGDNFFGLFEHILGDEQSKVSERLNIGDILKMALQHDAAQVRWFVLGETNHPNSQVVQQEQPPPPPTHQEPEGGNKGNDGKLIADGGNGSDSRIEASEFLRKRRKLMDQFALPANNNNSSERAPLSLMAQLIKRLVYDPEAGMQAQACEILRMMLDPETMEVTEKEKFLALFYENYIHWLVVPLESIPKGVHVTTAATTGGNEITDNNKNAEDDETTNKSYQLVLGMGERYCKSTTSEDRTTVKKALETAHVAEHHISELLSFCVQTHGYRIKYFVLRHNIVSKVFRLLYSRDKHLILGAIRFARTCVGLKDDFYNQHIIKFNLFQHIFDIFTNNGPRNNLINSAIMELLEFIRMENIKTLVSYIVEKFGPVLQKINYVDTYDKLLQRYQNNLALENPVTTTSNSNDNNSNNTNSAPATERPANRGYRASTFGEAGKRPSVEEEAYFESLHPSEKQSEQRQIVPYGDDDDNDKGNNSNGGNSRTEQQQQHMVVDEVDQTDKNTGKRKATTLKLVVDNQNNTASPSSNIACTPIAGAKQQQEQPNHQQPVEVNATSQDAIKRKRLS